MYYSNKYIENYVKAHRSERNIRIIKSIIRNILKGGGNNYILLLSRDE